jgi:periplasmic protein TonB
MVVISSVVTVISVISVYDYYTSKNWQQATSSRRNEVVFEKRNQQYGAYVIRRDYDSVLVYILLFFVGFLSLVFGVKSLFMKPVEEKITIPPSDFNHRTLVILEMPLKKKVLFSPDAPAKKQVPKDRFPEPRAASSMIVDSLPTLSENNPLAANSIPGDPDGNESAGPNGGGVAEGGDSLIVASKGPEEYPKELAQFMGGEAARQLYLKKSVQFPKEAFDSGGKCHLKFIVNENGAISLVHIEKGVPNCESCDREAMRVVKSMPTWKPAKNEKGEKIASYFRMVINFKPY